MYATSSLAKLTSPSLGSRCQLKSRVASAKPRCCVKAAGRTVFPQPALATSFNPLLAVPKPSSRTRLASSATTGDDEEKQEQVPEVEPKPTADTEHLTSDSKTGPAKDNSRSRLGSILGVAILALIPFVLKLTAGAAGADGDVAAAGGLSEGFLSAFLLIFFSEIGDKTFFIAVLLALKQPKSAVFAGTFGALAVMSFISVALGEVLHKLDELIPLNTDLPLDDYAAVALLVYFGVSTIKDAAVPKQEEEKAEAEEEVEGMNLDSQTTMSLIVSTFLLVFAAEWGDKSFLATIALAAASSPVGVVSGAIAGHGVATGIAVVGGSLLGDYVSEKTAGYVGGSLFLIFAITTLASTFTQ